MQISSSDFGKLDLRVGKILEGNKVPGSERLFSFKVDFGLEGEKTILSGLASHFSLEDFLGKEFIFVLNLESKKMRVGGIEYESFGMMLVAEEGERVVLVMPCEDLQPGSVVR